MSSVLKVMEESFDLLLEEPRLFVPKIFSTLTASIFMILLLDKMVSSPAVSPVEVSLMFAGLLAISVLGVYSSMMLSSMVKSDERSLFTAFMDVRSRLRNVLYTAAGFLLLGTSISILPVAGYLSYLTYGEAFILLIPGLLFLAAVMAVSYASYFLPITLLERKGVRSAVSDSFRTSEENRNIVIGLLLFSLALIAVAMLSTGYLEKLGYAGFVAGRLVSSIVNTYIFTVSPAYYIESRGENFD